VNNHQSRFCLNAMLPPARKSRSNAACRRRDQSQGARAVFDLCGIAPAAAHQELAFRREWLVAATAAR